MITYLYTHISRNFIMASIEEELAKTNTNLNSLIKVLTPGSVAGGISTVLSGFTAGAHTATQALTKLHTGTATTADAIDIFAGVLESTGAIGTNLGGILKLVSNDVLRVNDAMKESTKYGVNFNQNLGEYDKLLTQSQFGFENFNSMLGKTPGNLAALGGSMDKGAKIFLEAGMQVNNSMVGENLKAITGSADMVNTALRVEAIARRGQIKDVDNLQKATGDLAQNMYLAAKITGVTAEKQAQEAEKQLNRGDLIAAMLENPALGSAVTRSTAEMAGFGDQMNTLIVDLNRRGVASEGVEDFYNTLGPAQMAVRRYAESLGHADEATQARLAEEAKAAVLAQQATNAAAKTTNWNEDFAKSMEQTKDAMGIYSVALREQNINPLTASVEQWREVIRNTTEEEKKKYAALTARDANNLPGGRDPNAGVAQAINMIDELGRKVGGVIAEKTFEKLNTEVGASTGGFKDLQTFLNSNTLKDKIADLPDRVLAGLNLRAERLNREAEAARNVGGVNAPKQAGGSKDTFGSWFGADFGSGALSMLHGKEAVVPEGKIGEFMKDMSSQFMPIMANMQSQLGPQLQGMLGNVKATLSAAVPAMQSAMQSVQIPQFGGVGGGGEATITDVRGQLETLNTSMGELLRLTSESVNINDKQLSATRGLSGNRLD